MKYLIFFIATLAIANVSEIVNLLSKIQNHKPNFLTLNIPQIPKITQIKTNQEELDLKVKAFFNNKVFIDNKWYKKGDLYKGYKIIKITKKYIFLKKDKIYKIDITPKIGWN